MLRKRQQEEEIKYLDKYFWIQGRWWQRFIDRASKVEALRPVTDLDTIPDEYYDYYRELEVS